MQLMHVGKASIRYSHQLKFKSSVAMYLQQLLALFFFQYKQRYTAST